jgi:hypothetical protein
MKPHLVPLSTQVAFVPASFGLAVSKKTNARRLGSLAFSPYVLVVIESKRSIPDSCCAHSHIHRGILRICASRSSRISIWYILRDAVLTSAFLRLSGGRAALATSAVDSGATSGETNTATTSVARSEHGRVPGAKLSAIAHAFLLAESLILPQHIGNDK